MSMYEKVTINQSMKDYEAEQSAREFEAQSIYSAIMCYFHHKAETVYEDIIINLVGNRGLALLREFHLIETCAVLEGRKLYAL